MKITTRHFVKSAMATTAAMLLVINAEAQNAGGISPQMMQQFEKQHQANPASRALQNAVAVNSIDGLAVNKANAGAFDTYFSVETPSQSITNQKSSGRCWMFSGFNVLRGNFAKRTDSLTVSLSQNYLFFYDQLEKANLMLQGVIDHAKKPFEDQRVQLFFQSPINDGGTFCGVADLVEKYGLVPSSVQPESFSAENTGVPSLSKEVTSSVMQAMSSGQRATSCGFTGNISTIRTRTAQAVRSRARLPQILPKAIR